MSETVKMLREKNPELLLFSVGQILNACVRVHARRCEDILRTLSANTIDVSEADFDTLILRQVNTGNTCHTLKHLH